MATSFTLVSGTTWANGYIASSTALNNSVNLATFSSATASIVIGFDGSKNPCDIPYSFQISNGLNFNTGTSWHGTPTGLTLGNTSASTQSFIGQSSSNGLVFQWTYNATPSSAIGIITTFEQLNPIKLQASTFSADVGSQANFLQVDSYGRCLFSAAGATDGINQLQVQGGIGYDRQVAYQTTVAYASSVALDLTAGNNTQTISVSGALTLTTAHLGVGRQMQVIISNASGSSQSLTFPSWIFLGASAPANIANGKTGVLTIYSSGSTDAAVIAAWAVQP